MRNVVLFSVLVYELVGPICSIFFPNQMELAFPILVTIGNLVDPPATMINSTKRENVVAMAAPSTPRAGAPNFPKIKR